MGTREESNTTKSSNTTSMNSAKSGGDGSSNASEHNNNDYSARKKGRFNQMLADGMFQQPKYAPLLYQQDERELKRQKRKQSNRESARRSRLRKQAECEKPQHKVETLSSENRNLTDKLLRLSEECGKLMFENNSINEELVTLGDPDAVSEQENSTRRPDTPPCGDGC